MRLTTCTLALSIFLICAGCPDQDGFNPDGEVTIINQSAFDLVELRTILQSDTLLPMASPFTDQVFIENATVRSGAQISIPIEKEFIKKNGLRLFLYIAT